MHIYMADRAVGKIKYSGGLALMQGQFCGKQLDYYGCCPRPHSSSNKLILGNISWKSLGL